MKAMQQFLISLVIGQFALVGMSQAQWQHQRDYTLTVYEEVTQFMEIVGQPGYGFPANDVAFTGLGSVLLINNVLHDANPTVQTTNVVGKSRNVCTRVSADKTTPNAVDPRNQVIRISRCDLVIELTEGTILASGVFYENQFENFQPQVFSIIGGSGTFFGGLGEITLTQVVYPGAIVKLEVDLKTLSNDW